MPSFAPCLHEEADTRIFARATKAAKRPNKKISRCAVYTAIVILVISVVRNRCEWMNCGVGKNRWCEIKLSCFFSFTHRVQYSLVLENGG